jgi:hypothetical protein
LSESSASLPTTLESTPAFASNLREARWRGLQQPQVLERGQKGQKAQTKGRKLAWGSGSVCVWGGAVRQRGAICVGSSQRGSEKEGM